MEPGERETVAPDLASDRRLRERAACCSTRFMSWSVRTGACFIGRSSWLTICPEQAYFLMRRTAIEEIAEMNSENSAAYASTSRNIGSVMLQGVGFAHAKCTRLGASTNACAFLAHTPIDNAMPILPCRSSGDGGSLGL